MRFGLIHRIMTDALAVLGLLSLVTSGELANWISIALVTGVALAIAVPAGWQDRAVMRQFGVAAPILLLLTQAARLFAGAPMLELAVEFAAALQVVRLATRRGAAHDQQVIVLALLHLIAGTVLGSGIAYGLCFLGFLIVAPGALVLSHLRREVEGNYRQGARDRTGLPVDVPRILRSRRVIGKQFLLFTCCLSNPDFCVHGADLRALSACRPVAVTAQPLEAGTHGRFLRPRRPRRRRCAAERPHDCDAGRVPEPA